MTKQLISFVVPAYNESENIQPFYTDIKKQIPKKYAYEIIFVNDGSTDTTKQEVLKLSQKDSAVKLLSFSRNFGKEPATSAGISKSAGDAVIVLDADGQHPVEIVAEFIKKWEEGAQTVIGIRTAYGSEGVIKRYGSKIFYKFFNSLTHQKLVPGSTDFRLITAEMRDVFKQLHEKSRMTRALLDWIGYEKTYIQFVAKDRMNGEATYSTKKLVNLAFNSFVSLSLFPLYLSGYIGIFITPLSFFFGVFVLVEQYLLGDPLSLNITGSASLGILVVFLVGIILLSQGLLALYVSRIYDEVKKRPLFVIDESSSNI